MSSWQVGERGEDAHVCMRSQLYTWWGERMNGYVYVHSSPPWSGGEEARVCMHLRLPSTVGRKDTCVYVKAFVAPPAVGREGACVMVWRRRFISQARVSRHGSLQKERRVLQQTQGKRRHTAVSMCGPSRRRDDGMDPSVIGGVGLALLECNVESEWRQVAGGVGRGWRRGDAGGMTTS